MNKAEIKRKSIFDRYVANLNVLVEYELIDAQKDIYICPICLEKHDKLDLPNPLTLEDAPPKSLGGNANILTCKRCNNTCGHEIDFHLTQRFRDLDKKKLLPNSKFDIKFEIDNTLIRGQLEIDALGNQKFTSSLKNNNPKVLDEIMKNALGKKFSPEIVPGKVDNQRIELAILKTAYLIHFEKYGYNFILDKSFDIVREQLLNPRKRIYPPHFWITPNISKQLCGSYVVCNPTLRSFISIFNINTGQSEEVFMVFLPIPKSDINQIAANYLKESKGGKEIIFDLFPMNPTFDYLHDINPIRQLRELAKV